MTVREGAMTRRRRGSKKTISTEESLAQIVAAVTVDVRDQAASAREELDKAIKREIATAIKLWKTRLGPKKSKG